MSSGFLYVLIFAAVVISIVLNMKKNINLGITTLVFAYIIGCLLMGLSPRTIVNLTPVRVVFQLIAVTIFFSFAGQNGTMEVVANNILYKFRKQAWSLPLVLLLIGIVLGLFGAPNPMISVIVAVLGFRLAAKTGCNPILISIAAGLNGFASNIPYAQSGSIISGTIATVGYPEIAEAAAWKYFVLSAIFFIIVSLFFYFILKGYKASADIDMEKPPPINAVQRTNLIIIAITVGLIIISNVLATLIPGVPLLNTLKNVLDIQMLCIVGTIICILLNLGNEKEAISRGAPWGTIIMITGITILLGVAAEAGFTDFVGNAVGTSLPVLLIKPFLTFLTGIMSFFAGGITAVFPMFAPMIPSISEVSDLAPTALFCSLAIGGNITTISPFSVGGATILANCPFQEQHKKLFVGQLMVAIVGLAFAVLFSFIGFFSL